MNILSYSKILASLAVFLVVPTISYAKPMTGDWTDYLSGMKNGCETSDMSFQDDLMRFELPDTKRVQSNNATGVPGNYTSIALLKNVTAFGSNLNSITHIVNDNGNKTILTFNDDKFMKNLPTFFYLVSTSNDTIKLTATPKPKSFFNKFDGLTYVSHELGYKGLIKNSNVENIKVELTFNPQQKTVTCFANF